MDNPMQYKLGVQCLVEIQAPLQYSNFKCETIDGRFLISWCLCGWIDRPLQPYMPIFYETCGASYN